MARTLKVGELKTLIVNLKAYVLGFGKLSDLDYKPGWNRWKFLPVYIFDHGTNVLTGSAVVSWSRWFYVHRKDSRLAAFMNRLLGHAERNHGQLARPPLWGTIDCPRWFRYVLCAAWIVLFWSLL